MIRIFGLVIITDKEQHKILKDTYYIGLHTGEETGYKEGIRIGKTLELRKGVISGRVKQVLDEAEEYLGEG